MSTSSLGDVLTSSGVKDNHSLRPPHSLTSLPQDILCQVLDQLLPSEIAQYAQVNRLSLQITSDPSLWASVARRRLAFIPNHDSTLTSTQVYHLAQKLCCQWWLVTGALVPGVPVHRRRGFVNIQARGGCSIPLDNDKPETCYVFGGKYADRSIPVSKPCLAADFFLDPAGPFPVDGMTIRVVHAVEHVEIDDISTNETITSPNQSQDLGSEISSDETDDDLPLIKQFAKISVKVNNTIVVEDISPQGLDFNVTDIPISSNVLYNRPRVNTVSIEYDRSSTMGYWLREIHVVPKILPLPQVDPETLKFKSGTVNNSPPPQDLIGEEEETSFSTDGESRRSERNDDSQSRRPTRRRSNDFVSKRSVGEVQSMKRYLNRGKHLKTIKMPKHLYHHNHYRSPRGFAPGSPGKARSGR